MKRKAIPVLFASLLLAVSALGQVPHPRDVYGFQPGDDYKLASYDQMIDYYHQLAAASDRVQLREIGKTVLGRPLLLLTISTPENLSKLETWRSTAEKLARATVSESEAANLAKTGRAIVWIDGGLHATEVAHGQMTSLLAYRIATEESEEMNRIRENVITLLMPVMNPDGLEIVRKWYERNLGTPYETTRPPELYHHYIGHDNNRDWFMNNMPETRGVNDVLYREWYPQIVYNHHQTGPAWARIFIPPFADPVNPNIHPGVTTGVNMVGSAMANRFAIKKMPGAVSDMIYSMWWNGGMRTVPYFHNMIGILSETSHATPTPRYYDPSKRPRFVGNPRRGAAAPTDGTDVFYAYPWEGGESKFSDPVRYMITGSMAVLRLASDMREHWLTNIYQMGRDAIEAGRNGSPHAYVIPARQAEYYEAAQLVNVLLGGGVEVFRAGGSFYAGEQQYAAGDFVIPTAQAFRPYILDLLEAQVYPDRRQTPDGPPDPPYDLAGWTLPMQMGVELARIDTVPGNLQRVERSVSSSVPFHSAAGYGYTFDRTSNAAYLALNRLLAAGERVYQFGASAAAGSQRYGSGTFVIEKGSSTDSMLSSIANEFGVEFRPIEVRPVNMTPVSSPLVGLYKSWVASMDEGWTRWLLENYQFRLESLDDATLRTGDLSRFDVIVLPSQDAESILTGHTFGTMPEEYTGGVGSQGVGNLRTFIENGGRVVALDDASDFAIDQFGLPIRDTVRGVSTSSFFIPGSLIRMEVDTASPLGFGMQPSAAASFVRSRAFSVIRRDSTGEGGVEKVPEAPAPPVQVVARYPKSDLLMSGWALGAERYIGGQAAMLRISMGSGDCVLFGFRPQFRGQPRGTYKLFFNSLLHKNTAASTDEEP